MLSLPILTILMLFGDAIGQKIIPTNIFCWGKKKIYYDKFISRRTKIIWTIGIGFFVSAAATVIVPLLWSGSKV
jgi:hypothetical protein